MQRDYNSNLSCSFVSLKEDALVCFYVISVQGGELICSVCEFIMVSVGSVSYTVHSETSINELKVNARKLKGNRAFVSEKTSMFLKPMFVGAE